MFVIFILVRHKYVQTPYMLYKDSINNKSNQKNLGTIKSSNLCCEIVEYTNSEEIAVCNLASICLPRFIEDGQIKHKQLHKIAEVVMNMTQSADKYDFDNILQEGKRLSFTCKKMGLYLHPDKHPEQSGFANEVYKQVNNIKSLFDSISAGT